MASFRRLTAEQMETLSEIIFGLSITFSAIQFALSPPTTWDRALAQVAEFALSFTILVWVWISYVRIMSNLRGREQPPVLLNVLLLMLATVEPYLLYIVWFGIAYYPNETVAEQLTTHMAAIAWSIDLALILVILGYLAQSSLSRSDATEHPPLSRAVLSYARSFYACGAALLVSCLPFFWILIYSQTWTDTNAGVIGLVLHLETALWFPIFAAVAVVSWYWGREIDRALERQPRPHRASGADGGPV